jgi:hypothetical protein
MMSCLNIPSNYASPNMKLQLTGLPATQGQ